MNLDALPTWLSELLMVVLLLFAAGLAYRVTVRVGREAVRKAARSTPYTWDDRIIERGVLRRLANAVPALLLYYGIGPALELSAFEIVAAESSSAMGALLVQRVCASVIVISMAMAANALLMAVNDIYNDSYSESNNRPIKGYLQVVGLAIWITAGVIVVSILADRSPVVFLSGLGALTAVLMLVFRDTILSLVASLQIMSNDMIRIGDWIEMPQANTDGDVIDIALHTVKIQNWDKTISTIPTHRFISESFKNWRGMTEAGGRRIKRALHIDLSTVRFLSDEEADRLSRYQLLREYMGGKRAELQEQPGVAASPEPDVIPEVRRLTNIGTFRAYVLQYLEAHPLIHDDLTLLVRQLPPTPKGLPIEIYCFTNDTGWSTYEGIQGDIFDHLLAILPEFGLEAFQEPAGSDFSRMSGSDFGNRTAE